LLTGKHNLVYVFAAYVPFPYVVANLRTPPKFSQAVTAQSAINPDGSYVVPSTIDIDGLTLTPSKTGLLTESQRKFEILHFGRVTQWEAFRGVVISKQLFPHDYTSLPRMFFFFTRFTTARGGDLKMLWDDD
jgi:hypothetical protein